MIQVEINLLIISLSIKCFLRACICIFKVGIILLYFACYVLFVTFKKCSRKLYLDVVLSYMRYSLPVIKKQWLAYIFDVSCDKQMINVGEGIVYFKI